MLYLQPCTHFGGAERQASTVIPLLPDWGVDVVPLVGPNPTIRDWLEERGARDVILSSSFPEEGLKARGLEKLAVPFRYLRGKAALGDEVESILRRQHFDLVFAAMPFSWVAATDAAHRCGVPIVWRSGGTMLDRWLKPVLKLWAARHAPDLLVCCGDAVRDLFAPLIPAPVEVVRNGVDHARFHPGAGEARRYRPDDARLVVGFAGRLTGQKRPEDFIQMAARVAPLHPDVQFLVAGEGIRRAEYEALARSAGVADRVRFLGYVGDMPSFYAACDVVVLASYSEGCPNMVLEAMAMRRTLVVSDIPATTEVVTHGRDGLVYPVGDVEAFAAAVCRIADSDPLRVALARGAYDRARREFGSDRAAQRLALALRRVVRAHARPATAPHRPAAFPAYRRAETGRY